jgi:hypothetical protein
MAAREITLKDWRDFRRVARRVAPWADVDELDDLASEALLEKLRRDTCAYRAVVDALRATYGKSLTQSQRRRWYLAHPVDLDDTDPLTEPTDADRALVDADDLAAHLARGGPRWLRRALEGIARGMTAKDAAIAAGVTYCGLYLHLRRLRGGNTIRSR